MKKIVIPLTAILSIGLLLHAASVISDINKKSNDGDIQGISEAIAEEAEREAKNKIEEPFWILLVRNPLVWLLGFMGGLIGVKFVIK